MKRDKKTPIAGLIVLGFCLAGSGCSMVGSTVPLPPEDAASKAKPVDPIALGISPQELKSWSRLIKEGRGHLLLDRFDMAEQSLLAAFRISKFFRPSDIRRRVSFGNLERLATRYAASNYDAAATRVLSIIAIESKGLSEEQYPHLSNLLLDLGELQQRAGALEEANVSVQRALELRTEKNGPNSASLIRIYQRLSGLEIDLEHPDRAIVYAERGLELTEKHLGKDAPEAVRARLRAAAAYEAGEHYPEAVARYQAALKTQRKLEPASTTEVVVLNGMANAYLQMNRLDEALENVDLALSLLESHERGGLDYAIVLDTKAQVLAARGDIESAAKLHLEVMNAARSAPPTQALALYESYEKFLREQNRTTEASQVREQIERIELVGKGVQPELANPTDSADPMEALEQADQADPVNSQTGEHESSVIDAQRDLLSNSAGLPNVAAPPESHEAVSSVEPIQPEPEQADWP
ncbi:MAG: tetratricopeptide repeat protein [Deltaproteobacteria bacterium]|nr:tetratricopeptide repeat protein [Deltaproteobacteria bacterium]